MTLNEKLATIQTKFKSKKSRYNSFGKYYFRSAEDILEATKPFLLELGVNCDQSSERSNRGIAAESGFPIIESKATVITDGENTIDTLRLSLVLTSIRKACKCLKSSVQHHRTGKSMPLAIYSLSTTRKTPTPGNSHGKASKPKAKITSSSDAAFTKAMEYVKGGGKLDAIKAKYDLSPDVEKLLTTL